jgi:hypothetical protein
MPSCNHLTCHACRPQANLRPQTCEFCETRQSGPALHSVGADRQNYSASIVDQLQQPSKLQALLDDIYTVPNRKW